MKKCAEISKEATPEVTKEEPIPEKLEEEHIKTRTTPSVDFAESNETNKRSMSSAKPLRSSNKWIGFQSITEKYSTREDRSLTKRGWQERWKRIPTAKERYDLETTGDIFQKLFADDEVDPEHIDKVKRIMGIKPEALPYARLAEVYAIGSEEEEKTTPHLSCQINGVQCKALCDIGAQVSVICSKIYDKVQDRNLDLAPTSKKFIMGDGRTIRPLGIACNINVNISGNVYQPISLLLMLTIVIIII
jgi:hypothetical protein